MTYLVDTDVLIDYLRNVKGAADYLDSIGEWTYSVVTAMELITGAANQRDVKRLEKILNDYREMPLSEEIGLRKSVDEDSLQARWAAADRRADRGNRSS
jgi:predicted nucleic acid-binding protein